MTRSNPCGDGFRAAHCEMGSVANRSLLRGAGAKSAARCEADLVTDESLLHGAGRTRAAHCEVATVASGSLSSGAGASDRDLNSLRERIEMDMLNKTRQALMQLKSDNKWARASTKWPSHGKDILHDEDGGYDMFGRRTQDGWATLKQELAKFALSDNKE